MKGLRRWRPPAFAPAALAALVALVAVGGCSRMGVSVPQSPLLKYVERKSGRIALVGTDGNLAVMDQAGGGVRTLTADGRVQAGEEQNAGSSAPFVYYQLPVWAPDGSRVASVRIAGAGGNVEEASIVVVPVGKGGPVTVFASSTRMPGTPAWSPDSSRLVFLASSGSGSSFGFTLVPAAGGDPVLLDAGVPYGWAWSPRGDELVIHAGSAVGGLASGRLAFLDVGPELLEEGLGIVAGVFDAPAWSPDGRRVLVAAWEDGSNRLTLTNRKRTETATLAESSGPLTFAFSPDGQTVAYLASSESAEGSPSLLFLADVPGRGAASTPPAGVTVARKPLSGEDAVAAFFWSPDSSRIAYLVPGLVELPEEEAPAGAGGSDEAGGVEAGPGEDEAGADGAGAQQVVVLTLKVVEARKGAVREVTTFLPTPGYLGLVQQFAQLSQAVRVWSPDSRHLLYTAVDDQGPGVMVAMAAESIAPRRVSGGLEASWSRR
jgi:TolB protein